MRVYKTRRHPWRYLVYGADDRELKELDASGFFRKPTYRGYRTPQREGNATREARLVLSMLGASKVPPAELPSKWSTAERQRRFREELEDMAAFAADGGGSGQ